MCGDVADVRVAEVRVAGCGPLTLAVACVFPAQVVGVLAPGGEHSVIHFFWRAGVAERQCAAGDGWRVCACPCGGVARAAPACRVCGGGGVVVAVSCGGFEGCSCAWVVHEWRERRARLGEPVGVEGNIFVGFDVEEVCAADGERPVFVGELDHGVGRVGGVCDGDACGVAVFVWNHVAFLELAEFHPFPGAARFVGDVLVVTRCACGVVVCVRGHLCSPFPSRFSSLPRRAMLGGFSTDG